MYGLNADICACERAVTDCRFVTAAPNETSMRVAARRATVKMRAAMTVYRVDNFGELEVNQEKSDESIRSWCILYTVVCLAHMLQEADLRSSFERYHSLGYTQACDNYSDQVR